MQPITDVHELCRPQRAIRHCTNADVLDALVTQALTAAIHGPSGANTQPWHFIVIHTPGVQQAISEVYEEALTEARATRPSVRGGRQPLSAAPVRFVMYDRWNSVRSLP